MQRRRSRMFVALAAISIAGASVIGASGASATARRLVGGRAAVSPHAVAAGTYQASFPIAHISSTLVITATFGNGGTFVFSDIGDYGDWVMQGNIIAMQVASSVSHHEGTVLIGKVGDSGITGKVGVKGFGAFSWSATRVAPPAADSAASAARVVPHTTPFPRGLAGTYTTYFPGLTLTDTLVLKHDLFSVKSGSLTFVTLTDTGNWVQMGKHIALGVANGPDGGVTMVGTRTPTGISSVVHPGMYVQPSSGVFQWYAVK